MIEILNSIIDSYNNIRDPDSQAHYMSFPGDPKCSVPHLLLIFSYRCTSMHTPSVELPCLPSDSPPLFLAASLPSFPSY